MKQTQREWVIEQLDKYGEITRNQALSHFISRLGAIACDLKKDGYELTTKWRGGDFVYTLSSKPVKTIQRAVYDPITNTAKMVEVRV